MPDDVGEVKSRVDIVELIESYVRLRQAGSSFVGLCPFHSEKTPSFHVSRDRQTFHCFGCGKGGDIFSFVMEMEGLSFSQALEYLADRAGVKLSGRGPRPDKQGSPKSKTSRDALDEARIFFRSELSGPGGGAGQAYLARRGIAAEDAEQFELGWSPSSWDSLLKHLVARGFSFEEIFGAGLAVKSESGGYDRFRGRIMFPVRDDGGRMSGFGGRLIDGDGAKYINSPEGELFNKRKLLYLLDRAKRAIRERGRIILVEGYMDAMRAHMRGFTETVASLGTSLTEEQAALVKRFADLCYIAYDADAAGNAASVRGMYILQRHGVDVRVAILPEGLDPDDVLSREGGEAAFDMSIGKAMPLPLYHVRIKRKDLKTPGKNRSSREEVLSGLASLPALDIAEYIPRIARGFGILEHELRGEIDARRKDIEARDRKAGRYYDKKSAIYAEGIARSGDVYINGDETPAKKSVLDLECALCSLLWQYEELRSRWSCGEIISSLSDEAVSGIASALVSGDSPDALESRWRMLGERACFERLARGDLVRVREALGPEHAYKMMDYLKTGAMKRRVEVLKPLVISGDADSGEAAEYHDLEKKLKVARGDR